MYANIDHAKGFHPVSKALQFRGPLYDGIMNYHYKITIFSLIGNGIFMPLILQWSTAGKLIMPTYICLNLRSPYVKQVENLIHIIII